MSFEAITTISEAEEQAKRLKLQAQQDAKAALADVRARGTEELESAAAGALEQVREKRARVDAQAKADAQALADETEGQKQAMLTKAEARMDKAAALIVERVVNG